MTSTANPQKSNQAPTTAAPSAPSYASAAGASKKPGPIVASGSHPSPPVAVGSSASASSNAKPSSASPVNGRPSIPPAVPAVASSSTLNGGATDQNGKGSVTILANAPTSTYSANGGPVGGNKPLRDIQFGFSSPQVAHNTPQPGDTPPVPIPGSATSTRIASPAQSPSPIPQPSASGGRPPSGLPQSGDVKPSFGSFNNDPERHMRTGSMPANNPALQNAQGMHNRQPSNISMASTGDMPNQPMNHNRGGYHGSRGGRTFNPNQPPYTPNASGYQHPQPSNYGNARGRANMPPSFQSQGNRGYPNSPQPARASPHLGPSHPNTPQMGQAMPVPQATPPYGYGPPMAQQPVQSPSFGTPPQQKYSSHRRNKRNGRSGRDSDRSHDGSHEAGRPHYQSSRFSKQGNKRHGDPLGPMLPPSPVMEYREEEDQAPPPPLQLQQQQQPMLSLPIPPRTHDSHVDLSPEYHNFEKIQAVLTDRKQNMTGYPPQFPPQYGGPMGPMSYNYPGMGYPAQSNSPGFGGPYTGGPQYHPGPSAMSRTPSSSEKPLTPAGPPGPPMIVGTPNQSAPGKPGSNVFSRPKKSAAITIKRPDGEAVDLKNIKAPASPASSIQQSKTPPIATSSSTPPTKPSTPAHSRTDSQAPPKSAKEVQDELRAKIAQATKTSSDSAKEEEAAKAAAAEKAAAEEKAKAEAEAKAKKEAEEKAAEEAKLKAEQKAKEEEAAKAAEEAKRKAEAAEAAAAAVAEKAKAEAEAEAKKKQEEDDEIERVIREMEEEDRRREEAAAKYAKELAAKKAAEKEAAEKNKALETAEKDRKLREQEREMERLEDEKERRAKQNAAAGLSVADLLAQSRDGAVPEVAEAKVEAVTERMASITLTSSDSKPATPTSATGSKLSEKGRKPAALNLSVNTKPVEAPQPSAALQALKTSRFLTVKESLDPGIYSGTSIASPNPALNPATFKRGQAFKYDANFLLQFQNVFTEQPSVEFTSQVKSLIGDTDGNRSGSARTPATAGGRQNSRTGSGFPGGMGSMGSFSQVRTLPPGTTSAERMAMSQGNMARPPMGSTFGQGGGGTFPRPNIMGQMGRQPSNSGMNPNSPRQGSRPGRGGSHRSGYNPKEQQAAKTMPLTQGQELKALQVSTTGWKPISLTRAASQQPGADGHMDPKMVQRKVQAALNKMTPENFDKISEHILVIANQSKNENDGRTLRQVIQLTFEKATDEPHFSTTYAKFCKRMLDQMSNEIKDDAIKDKHGNVVSGGNLFRKYLLNRCQEDFEKGWSVGAAAGDSNQAPAAALMSDEYYVAAAAKRRGLGLVRFIGELFKLGMLTERIIHGCIHSLVDYKDEPREAEIESLCYLLKTVGAQLDASDKGPPMMSAYFERIQKMIELPDLENRLKFMLMDVRDMRNHNWRSKEANKGPKTLDEVRAEAEAAAAAKAQEAARSNIRGGGGRPGPGRGGDNRNFSAGYNQTSNTVGMDDLRRLKSGSRNSGPMTLGPHSMLASRSNSGRRGGPGGPLARTGEDSGMSSRTGTPPTHSTQHANAYGLLANLESENPTSPPSTAASPSMSKVTPDASADKKD